MFELFRIIHQRSMYRQSIMEQEQQQHPQLLSKLNELPIVNDTYQQVLDIYERTKGHNFLFRTTFGLAEATAKAVAGKTVPIIVNRYQPQMERVNSYACGQLDSLEEKYPIITRSTEEVLRETKEKYDQTVGPYVDPVLRPAVAAVNVGVSAVNKGTAVASAVVDTGKRSVNAVTKLGTDTVSGVYGFGRDQVAKVVTVGQGVVNQGLQTQYGQYLTQQFDKTLDTSEQLLEKYLPEDSGEEEDGEKKEPEETVSRKERVTALTQRLQRRLYRRTDRDLKRYKATTLETIQHLGKTFDVMALLKEMQSKAQSKLHDARAQTMEYVEKLLEEVEQETNAETPASVEDRTLALARVLMSRFTNTVAPLMTAAQEKCGALKGRVADVTSFLQESITTFTGAKTVGEIPSELLKKANETLPYVTELVLFAFDRMVETLDWFALDLQVNLNDMDLEDVAMVNCNGMAIQPADGPEEQQ